MHLVILYIHKLSLPCTHPYAMEAFVSSWLNLILPHMGTRTSVGARGSHYWLFGGGCGHWGLMNVEVWVSRVYFS